MSVYSLHELAALKPISGVSYRDAPLKILEHGSLRVIWLQALPSFVYQSEYLELESENYSSLHSCFMKGVLWHLLEAPIMLPQSGPIVIVFKRHKYQCVVVIQPQGYQTIYYQCQFSLLQEYPTGLSTKADESLACYWCVS